MAGERIAVQVDGRRLTLSNLDKVLYPAAGFTKRDVIDYYAKIAPSMLPHLQRRPATFRRYPDGVDHEPFYEKDVARHAPGWVRTARLESHHRGEGVNSYPLINDVPTLVWAANLAALELHVPQWTVGPKDARRNPDLLVFDLDPGEPATVVECCQVARWLHEALTADGLTAFAKTSGSKGLQLYCAIRTRRPEAPSEYAEALARRLAAEHPDLVVARMTKTLRRDKVFIDWSQNNQAKTTVAPYSLRGRQLPTVSTPVTWAEVSACRRVEDMTFTSEDTLARVRVHGDLFDGLPETRVALPRISAASGK
ncbi:non-homologous end-joining DNA ligase [Amycolatopsis alkalitolerans]|uniref:ATP-dependent DNA ligase n=1 Tax=Amycolatopsis alkalitolerans TaxID=2547244 RepID=A0A5C4MC13_9PSEU|nr:non-homologous end-joining DNA ligase [Amycolatopsis alkalitolerans]TNC29682.1 ATP-dependent DNA ligase [Amycolatopsis alkalitolerans]